MDFRRRNLIKNKEKNEEENDIISEGFTRLSNDVINKNPLIV